MFANLQEINRLEEQIKRGGPQGKQNLEQMAEKLEQAGNGQIYFADMSPEKMDRKLLQLAGETGIQLSGVETGETKEMDTAGYVYTPLTLDLCVQTGNRQPDLWKRSTRKAPVCG